MSYEKRIKHRKIKLCDISHKSGKAFNINIEKSELDSIAIRLKVPAIRSLQTSGSIKKLPDVAIYRIDGKVNADIALVCTVSLEEFAMSFEEPLQWDISHDKRCKPERHSAHRHQNHPEYIEEEAIDVIEYAIQTLSLALPPYPRRTDADLSYWQNCEATARLMRRGWLTFNAVTPDNSTANNPFSMLNASKHDTNKS